MTVRLFSTRLSVEGSQQYESRMRRAGRTGQQAMQRVERSTRPASRGLRLVSAGAAEARQRLGALAGQAPGVGVLATRLGALGIAVGAVAVGLVALARRAQEAVAAIAAIGDAADRANVAVDLFENLQAAITLSGQETGGLEQGLLRFTRAIDDAERGSVTAIRAFQQLGVDIVALREAGASTEDILFAVADGFRSQEDAVKSAAAGQTLFGRSGGAVVATLRQGSDALRAQIEEARELGLIYGNDLVRQSQAANIELEKQSQIIDVRLNSAFAELAPLALAFREGLAEMAEFAADAFRGLQSIEGVLRSVQRVLSFLNPLLAVAVGELTDLLSLGRVSAADELRDQLTTLEGVIDAQRQVVVDAREAEGTFLAQSPEAVDLARREVVRLEYRRAALTRRIAELEQPVEPSGSGGARVPQTDPDTGGGAGRAAASRDEFAQATRQLRERVEALRFEAETAGLAADEIARLEAVRTLANAATADGTEISTREAEVIRQLSANIAAATAAKAGQAQASRDLAEADRAALREVEELQRGLDNLGRSAGNALGGLIAGTNTWQQALAGVLQTVLRIAETQLSQSGIFDGIGSGVSSAVGGFLSSAFGGLFADGAAFRNGRVVPFASGGLVTGPTYFPMSRGRTGVMGEAGAEAILPLTRTASGGLGVRAEGGGGSPLVFHSNVDARGAAMSSAEYRVIARQEAERAVGLYDRRVAGPSLGDQARRLRT